jgi:hypothetical protein
MGMITSLHALELCYSSLTGEETIFTQFTIKMTIIITTMYWQ